MSRAEDVEAGADWLAGYDDPVVRPAGSSKRIMHAPAEDTDEPLPLCGARGRHEPNWLVSERSAIESHYSACNNDKCSARLPKPLATDDEEIIAALSGEFDATEGELQATFHEADSERATDHVLNALAELRREEGESY